VEGETEMKSADLGTFFLGVTFGIGLTLLALYTQKPGGLVTSMETIAETRRARRAKEEEKKLQRERLKAVGFSDEEIDEFLQ
jgi:hypothetical protein